MYRQTIKMEGLRNDLFITAYGQSENIETHTTSGPRAYKVSLDSTGEEVPFLPTPPDSPVFAELTTAGQDIKPDITKLKRFQEGPQAVPNLEMNPSLPDTYNLNTVYSTFQTTSPFYEGNFCDDPFGTSNNVLVKQEPDMFPDVFTNPLESTPMYDQGNPHQYMNDWSSQTSMSRPTTVFEAAPIIKDEYSIPSPTSSSGSSYESVCSSMGAFQTTDLPDFTSFTGVGRDHLNSGGEDTEFDSGSEASFSLTPDDSEDSLDDISPFDPSNSLCINPPRTHNYKRNTVNVTMMKGGIPKVSIPKKQRGRPRKLHNFPGVDGNGLFQTTARRGRGRREAMKGNHLWEFIRDLLKDSTYCPKFIRWEEKDEGVFRFVNSEAVANMWGRKKNNPAMTYEKLSRAMRYYYKRDILERVDGRRLVYKFGKNASGWRQAAGITDPVDK